MVRGNYPVQYKKKQSRGFYVDELTKTKETKIYILSCLVKQLRGNTLWTVWLYSSKISNCKRTFLRCDFLFKLDSEWDNFRWFECSSYTIPYITCPAAFFLHVPLVRNALWREQCASQQGKRVAMWTEIVKQYRLAKKNKSENKVVVLKFIPGNYIPEGILESIQPVSVRGPNGQQYFFIHKKYIQSYEVRDLGPNGYYIDGSVGTS